ncbi:MAG TPA: hypothetical protein VFS52_09820 [Steroidobacteraceae bacterium]|nr:hypothetical protein [Steroidobacteraceae bacterium]
MSTRREFMIGTVAAGGAIALAPAALAATEPLFLADDELAHASRLAADAASRGWRIVRITGDRVRFAREVFGPGAPDVVAGATRYADFIVLAGCASEAGYRLTGSRAEGGLVRWKVVRLRPPVGADDPRRRAPI